MTKFIEVNLIEKTVTINNETCNTQEAGLEPSGELVTDVDEIIEHFQEREGECEVVFVNGDRWVKSNKTN